MKCETCINSRTIISENGTHAICTFSSKTAMQCMTGRQDRYVNNGNVAPITHDAEKIFAKTHCDWIGEKSQELKALIEEGSDTVKLNRSRALTTIKVMKESLNELKAYIEEL